MPGPFKVHETLTLLKELWLRLFKEAFCYYTWNMDKITDYVEGKGLEKVVKNYLGLGLGPLPSNPWSNKQTNKGQQS